MQADAAFAAQVRQIVQFERAGRHAEALAALRGLAEEGSPDARFYLAQKLLIGENAPREPQEGMRLLTLAGDAEHGEALHLLAVLSAAGQGCAQDWGAAMRFLAKAAEAGHTTAKAQLALLGQAFDLGAWLSPPAAEMQFTRPRVGVIAGFLPGGICKWLIERARPRLAPAMIAEPGAGRTVASRGRTNTVAYMPLLNSDVIVQLVRARIAAALDVPSTHLEAPNVLHYQVGQIFETHYDFMDPALPGYAQELASLGQRVATFLVYLDQDFDGGETAFPELDWRFRGSTGDAVFFWNVRPDGAVEPKLAHAGAPPTRGEKWLLSQWVRERPIPLI